MTTATETHTPSNGCYKRGCKEPGCLAAGRRYAKLLAYDITRGVSRMHDTTQVRAHIERLQAREWTHRQIANAARVARATVSYIAAGQPETSKRIALAILSIPIGPAPKVPSVTDATGTIRRVRALAFIGHTLVSQADRLDMTDDRLSSIARGAVTVVRISEAQAITRMYRQLAAKPGPSERARADARKKGWHGPLDWDEIDNPNCKPETEHRATRAKTGSRPKVYADPNRVAELTAANWTAEQIANEIGCHKRSVVRARRRSEQMAVAA